MLARTVSGDNAEGQFDDGRRSTRGREAWMLTPAQSAYLDLLRGGAAQAVLVGHALLAFGQPGPLLRALPHTAGVLIFFLLSGFLITLTTLRKASSDPGYGFGIYVVERGFRIFTPYVPALLFVAAVDQLSTQSVHYPWRRDFDVATWVANLLMLQEYPLFQILRRLGMPDQPSFFGPFGSGRPFWTISIEWWIYLLFGFALFFLVRSASRRTAVGFALAGLLAVEPAYHLVGGFGECLTAIWIAGMTLAATDAAIRARVAALWNERPGGRALVALAVAMLALFVVVRLYVNELKVYELQLGLLVTALLFLVYHLVGASGATLPVAVRTVPRFIAAFSYSLYLTHFTVLTYLLTRVADGALDRSAALWLCLVGSNLVAIVFWWLFERHHRALGRAFLERFRLRPTLPAAAAGEGTQAK